MIGEVSAFQAVQLQMVGPVRRAGIVDVIWLVAADGRWHSPRGLIQRTGFEWEELAAALRFLVKYGFAESSTAGEEKFRIIMDGPSPTEAANILRVVGLEAECPSSYGCE